MNLNTFFEHWGITENPFRGEEARHDAVFLRLGKTGPRSAGDAPPASQPAPVSAGPTHPDFEKIAGDFSSPSTGIVFGEKGSGKTAIRLQLAARIAAYNTANPDRRCLLLAYDDLNPMLDRFHSRFADDRKRPTTTEIFKRIRLVDHVDAILGMVVPGVVDGVLGDATTGEPERGVPGLTLGADPRKVARKLDVGLRRDLLVLQAVYDRGGGGGGGSAEDRSGRLRRALRLPLPTGYRVWTALAYLGWIPPVAIASALLYERRFEWPTQWQLVVAALLALWLLVLLKRSGFDRLAFLRLGRRLRRQNRVSGRSDSSYARSLRQLESSSLEPGVLPTSDSDEQRYEMFDRMLRVLQEFGYATVVIVIDRVDEPTLISGEPERMQAVVWPLLNNKFLTQPGVGVKMLLPMELRHALFRESAAFFQEARLDKQNLIERLNWSGAMLYDLCSARLTACRQAGADPVALIELFGEDVTRQELVDALDQMHQPRDAFKMLYQCLTEHCSMVTEDAPQWRIPRLVLQTVLKEQSERVRQLYRGVRPA
ncbi:MAG: hypothetical protein KF745_01090 [Phycisphaeraceae bacterium]|nr:hypothetical protein [Phycisphaeraceae bacterium]